MSRIRLVLVVACCVGIASFASAQHLIPVGAKLPAPPEPAPFPKLFPVTEDGEGPVLPVSDQVPIGTPVSQFNEPDSLPENPDAPRFPISEEVKESLTPSERPRGQLPKTWGADEYLLWWIKDSPALPVIAVSGLDGATPVLGGPKTTSFGSGGVGHAERSGARLAWGWAFDDDQSIGMRSRAFSAGDI